MKRLLPLLLFGLVLTGNVAPAAAQVTAQSADSLYAVYLLSVVVPQPDVAHYVVAYAHLLEGTPYAAGSLDRDSVEQLQAHLQETDCTIFVETVLALARTAAKRERTWEAFGRELTALRYRDGRIDGYPSRLHYFSDWIIDNERRGNVKEMTAALGGVDDTLQLHFMSRHAHRYPALQRDTTLIGVIASQEKRLSGSTVSVLPAERLDSAALAGIQSGDIIAFTTDIDGLDIAHVGIALNENGTVRLIHASSIQRAVVIEKRALTLQLRENRRFTGIRIIRPLNVTARK